MAYAPYCKPGSRRCSVSKQCLKKTLRNKRKGKCNTGSRKCSNGLCYKKNKSVKSRTRFNNKYGK
jgi:hypothetical protein